MTISISHRLHHSERSVLRLSTTVEGAIVRQFVTAINRLNILYATKVFSEPRAALTH